MQEKHSSLFAEAVAKEQLVPMHGYVRGVLERFLEENAEFRPKKASFFTNLMNDIFSPLEQTAVIPGGQWARAAEGLKDERYDEINIGVHTSEAQIPQAKIFVDVGLPSAGPSITVPPRDKFEKLNEAEQFDIVVRAMPWVNLLAKNFAPDLFPRPRQSSGVDSNLGPASLN